MASTKLSAAVLAGLLTVTLAACGSNDTETGTTTATSSSSAPAATPAAAASPKVLAELPDLSKGVSTTVTLDPQFVAGLTSLMLTPGVVGETKLEGGALIFPITGGSATLYEKGTTGADPFIVGVIKHDNQGITLSGGGKKVELKNFDVDAGKSEIRTDITVDGAPFGMDVPTFIADGSTLTYPPTMEGNNAILQGTRVKLTAGAASALNTVFGTTALTEGFPIGVAKIAVATS
ncbi:MAG TPA: hypothetical protein VFR07_06075 [Mycobacteriales bacterium]|jgi:hypothetical protein|nr:hypothetical protein [Mycobacteriales bacterium]